MMFVCGLVDVCYKPKHELLTYFTSPLLDSHLNASKATVCALTQRKKHLFSASLLHVFWRCQLFQYLLKQAIYVIGIWSPNSNNIMGLISITVIGNSNNMFQCLLLKTAIEIQAITTHFNNKKWYWKVQYLIELFQYSRLWVACKLCS